MRSSAAIAIGLLAVMVCFAAAVGLTGSWTVATPVAIAGGASWAIGTTWTLAVLALMAWTGRKEIPAARQPLVCLALLMLLTLSSPFLPQGYAGFPPIWLLTLFAAVQLPNARTLAWVIAGWLCFNLYWPQDLAPSARTLAFLTLVPQTLAAVLALRVLWAIPAGVAAAEPATANPIPTPASV